MDGRSVLPWVGADSLDYDVLVIGSVAHNYAGVLLDLALTRDVDEAAAIVRDKHFVVAGNAQVIDNKHLLLCWLAC